MFAESRGLGCDCPTGLGRATLRFQHTEELEFMKRKTKPPYDGPAVVPRLLLRRKEVSHGAKLTYVKLRQVAGAGRVVLAHVPALAQELGEDEVGITRSLAELRGWGLVEAVAGVMSSGEAAHCFLPPHPWVEETEPRVETVEGASEGRGRAKREVLSKFSYEQCFEYATYVAEREAGSENPIRNVKGLAGYYFYDGVQDEEIAAWFTAKETEGRGEGSQNVLPYKKPAS